MMKTRLIQNGLLLLGLALLAACNDNSQPGQAVLKPVDTTSATEGLQAPFRYHKLIESSPGKYFDVLGWGRGKDSIGGYLILHSDSAGRRFPTVSGDLEGAIIDVFNTDMNMDGNPEILIEAKAKDTTNHINIYAYEFTAGKPVKLNFPQLSNNAKKAYRGDDKLYIKEGNLLREFPLFAGSGKAAKATGKKMILQYGLRSGVFTIKDISPVDSAALKAAAKPVAAAAPAAAKAAQPAAAPVKHHHKHHRQ